ncbi:MAG: ATP-binding protein [Bacillota bacterium]|nr:ATP-binding protein [Bacillota bacterium]
MIVNVRINNSFVFVNEVELSLKADMRNKKFATNVYSENNYNILKAVGIYGPNNVGKTCLIKSIRSIRNVLLNKDIEVRSNIFNKSTVCEMGVTFLEEGREFKYDFKYDAKTNEYLYERFIEIVHDQYSNEKEIVMLIKDSINKEYYYFKEKPLEQMLQLTAKNNILIYLIDTDEFDSFREIKNILLSFASKIEVIDMNNIPIGKTIELLKNKDQMQEKIVNFIKNADLDMDNYQYIDDSSIAVKVSKVAESKVEEDALNIPERVMDQIRLTSVYKGIPVPSFIFDSTGTKKIAALASYIIEALEKGKILVIDELDSSIHFKLTRAIVSMFNNELNMNAQLIFSVHDINLMDCKKLFRKEQIWFVHKDKKGIYLYSLAEFTANKDGIRDTTDIIDKYRKGILGALPEPDMINTLLEVKHE